MAPPAILNFAIHRPNWMGTCFLWDTGDQNADIAALSELESHAITLRKIAKAGFIKTPLHRNTVSGTDSDTILG